MTHSVEPRRGPWRAALVSVGVLVSTLVGAVGAAEPANAWERCNNLTYRSSSWGWSGYCVHSGTDEMKIYVDDIETDGSCVWTMWRGIPANPYWYDLSDNRGRYIRSCGPNTEYNTDWLYDNGDIKYGPVLNAYNYGIRVYRNGNYFTMCDGPELRVTGPLPCMPRP